MRNSPIHDTLMNLTEPQWRTLRLSGWAACLAQLMVLWKSNTNHTRVFDLLLLGCYLMITTAFLTGHRNAGKTRKREIQPATFSTVQRVGFRSLIATSVALFLFGASRDHALFFSPGMVSLLFMAVFLWVVTARSAAPEEPPTHAEQPATVPVDRD